MSLVTKAVGPGPGCDHGDQIIDHPNRDISENERDFINNYAKTTGISWNCPRQTETLVYPNITPVGLSFHFTPVLKICDLA